MKKSLSKLLALTTSLFALSAGFLVNHNLKRHYKPDEYIPELNAYYGGEITDPAGHIKAHKFVTPSDNKYSTQKTRSLGTDLVGDIESVWSSYTGKGTKIAIIDDGFDYEHPEYTRSDGTSAILPESRYYFESGSSYSYQKYSDDPSCIGEDWESDGSGGYEWATHGTATSTTAAAPIGNGGGVGIAPEADILALKIDFSFASIDGAIRYAVAQGVDVINMSLGAYADSFTDGFGDKQSGGSSVATYLNTACNQAYNAGIIVVAAAGNEATYHKSYPACNNHVIGVGALGDYSNKGNSSKLAEFTNYVKSNQTGEINVDILAPGYVYTAARKGTQNKPTHTYEDTQGTSFSSPIIAGAACLWKQKNPNGTPDQFLTQLQSSADGIGYYTSKYVPVSGWESSLSDVGPSAIENGRLNVANLLDINDPYVTTEQSSFNIAVGEKRQIRLGTYSGSISYSSNNTSVATVSNTGEVEGKGTGTTKINVIATKNNKTAKAEIDVTVYSAVASTSLTFNPDEITMEVGETYNAEQTIQITPSNASRIFMYESLDESIATVDDDGIVTAIKAGQTQIYAIALYGSSDVEDYLNVTVNPSSSISDTLTRAITGISGSTYTAWSGKQGASGAIYAGQSAGGNDAIQLRSNNSNSGIVTTSSGGVISKISVEWTNTSGRVLNVYGKTSSYSSPSDLYGNNSGTLIGTIDSDSATELEISGNYTYVGVRSSSGALYLASITFVWNGSGGGTPSPTPTVTSVTVSPSELTLDLYGTKTATLTATVSGTNSPAQTVGWVSSNNSVVTVSSSGYVEAYSTGTATITATSTVDSSKSGKCTITVEDSTPEEKTLSSIAVSGNYKISFEVGDTFTFGGIVTATYSDNSTENVTSQTSFSGYNMSASGTQTVTASYTYNGVTKTASYNITVTSSGGSGGQSQTGSQRIVSNASSTHYQTGSIYPSGSGSSVTATCTAFTMTWSQNSGTNSIVLSYDELRIYTKHSITITPNSGFTLLSIEIEASSTSYTGAFGGTSLNNCTKTTNSTAVTLTPTNGESSVGFTNSAQGRADYIIVYYSSESTIIPDVTLDSITLDTSDVQTSFTIDDTFTYAGLIVYAHYSNGVDQEVSSNDYSITPPSMTSAGEKTVTVTYGGQSATYTIVVVASGGGGGGGGTTPSGDSITATYTLTSKTSASTSGTAPTGSSVAVNNNGSNDTDQMTSGKRIMWTLTGYDDYIITMIEVNLRRSSKGGSGSISLTNNSSSVSLAISSTSSSNVSQSYDLKKVYNNSDGFKCNGQLVLTITANANSLYCNSIKVTYAEPQANDKIVDSLNASYSGGDLYIGDTLDTSKVSVTASYTDSTKYPDEVLSSSNYSITGFSSTSAGEKTVNVTYTGSLLTSNTPLTTTFTVLVIVDEVSSVTIVSSKTYHPGETITKSDLTATVTYDSGKSNQTTDFTFSNDGYMFTYDDTEGGGLTTAKSFSIVYQSKTYRFTVNVSRNSYINPTAQNISLTGTEFYDQGVADGTTVSDLDDYPSLVIGGVTYSATNIGTFNDSSTGRWISFGKGAGEFHNTTPFSSALTSVTLNQMQERRQDGKVYVSEDGATWILLSNANFSENNYYYFKVTYETASTASGKSGYSNFKVDFSLTGAESPVNVANFIMYEDSLNQCEAKFEEASLRFEKMDASGRASFMTSNDYVISTARERFIAWARHEGKTIDFVNNDYVVSQSKIILPILIGDKTTQNTALIVVITLVSLTALGGYFFVRKRKEQ